MNLIQYSNSVTGASNRVASIFFEEASGRLIKGRLWGEGQMMEEPHDHVSDGFSGMASFVHGHIRIKTCL